MINSATTPQRKIVLEIVEDALSSIQTENVLNKNFTVLNNKLSVKDKIFDLSIFQRVFLIGFAKGLQKIQRLSKINWEKN